MTIPTVAKDMFGDRLNLAEKYAQLLCTDGIKRGLIGPREADRIWNRHVLNCALLAEIIDEGKSVVDIGSGAGLPGIPLAIARPDVKVVLIEPLLRRTKFLDEVVAELKLDNVTVVRGRAEEGHIQREVGTADYVTSRAVAPLGKLAKWSAPYAAKGSYLVALKGESAQSEIDRDKQEVGRAGWRNEKVVQLSKEEVDDTFVVTAVRV
ncbi:MAG TPA: 16S rRNA (guanine(527)-N(7))-methyltransferase RsmG [Corynebacteriales bacterium]|nr:16S rRNA (guanine(527)-N(7))-methyltransferase RsmG [Mycobacteriales bacterium]